MAIFRFVCSLCGPKEDPCEHYDLSEIRKEQKFLHKAVLEIIHLLLRQTGFHVSQLQGEQPMPITGIVAGASGVFQAVPTPQGAVIPAGTVPVWTSSDTANAPVTPAADGLTCSVAVPASATITSFTLSVQNQDGTFPTSVTVPVTPAPPPPPPAQTGFEINQIS